MISLRSLWRDWPNAAPRLAIVVLDLVLVALTAFAWTCALAQLIQIPLGSRTIWMLGHSLPSYVGPWLMIFGGYLLGRKLNRGLFLTFRAKVAAALAAIAASLAWTCISFRAWRYPVRSWGISQSWVFLPILTGSIIIAVGMSWGFSTSSVTESDGYKTQLRAVLLTYVASLAAAPLLNWLFRANCAADITRAQRWSLFGIIFSWIAVLGIVNYRDLRQDSTRLKIDLPAWRRAIKTLMTIAILAAVIWCMIAILLGKNVTAFFFLLAKIGFGIIFVIGAAIAALQWCYFALFGLFSGKRVLPYNPPELVPITTGHSNRTSQHFYLYMWVGLGAFIVLIFIIVLSLFGSNFRRRKAALGRKERVYEKGLLGQQLRSLFTRKKNPESITRKISLDQQPRNPREAMLYVGVLAQREGIPWYSDESAQDFISRLNGHWPQELPWLATLLKAYEPERYGHEPGNGDISQAWHQIAQAHHG